MPDAPPPRSLTRTLPGPATIHVTHRHPGRAARIAVAGHWRAALVLGWAQARAGAPVIITTQWSDGQYNRIDHWTYDADLVIPEDSDIWGPQQPR